MAIGLGGRLPLRRAALPSLCCCLQATACASVTGQNRCREQQLCLTRLTPCLFWRQLVPCRIGEKTPTVDYAEPSKSEGGGGGGGGGGHSQVKNVFVGNLPPGATEERLRDIFSKYGEVS